MTHSTYILIKIEDVSLDSPIPEKLEHTIISLLHLIPNNWTTNVIDERALEVTKDEEDTQLLKSFEILNTFRIE
jgi:hypothetical protein